MTGPARSQGGQALILLVGVMCAVVAGAFVLGAVARGVGAAGDRQRAADLAALAGARALADAYPRVFEPAILSGQRNPRHLDPAEYLERGGRAALETARRNGAKHVRVAFPDRARVAPVRVRVEVADAIDLPGAGAVAHRAVAEAEVVLPEAATGAAGEYRGPFARRQGKPMRPDVALAFDRMAAAARADGIALVIASAFRTDAEQAALFAARPDPRWVAPPGQSLHRLGTELDLGPPRAYGWLADHAERFGFVVRYAHEPWHLGYARSPGTASVGYGGARPGEGAVPAYVPPRYIATIRRAAQRWSVSAALLAAQIRRESGFDASARSPAGALGIAQLMPATARTYGVDPLDPDAAIDAQARLMRDLLRAFASVPLALAAYNAGPAPVRACGCVPPYRETRAYVADILAMLGVHDSAGAGALRVLLVR